MLDNVPILPFFAGNCSKSQCRRLTCPWREDQEVPHTQHMMCNGWPSFTCDTIPFSVSVLQNRSVNLQDVRVPGTGTVWYRYATVSFALLRYRWTANVREGSVFKNTMKCILSVTGKRMRQVRHRNKKKMRETKIQRLAIPWLVQEFFSYATQRVVGR